MCKASALLQDQSSVNGYLELIRTWMKDTTSLVACSVKSGRVIGTAITRIDSFPEKTDVYGRVQILEGEKLKNIMHLMNTLLLQTKPYEKFEQLEYFRIYLLCVHPSYQEKGIEVALLDVCVQVAKSMHLLAIGGIFTCGSSQTRAHSIGFKLFSEIRYNRWIVHDRVVFDDPGRGNYSAAFMGMLTSFDDEPKDRETLSNDTLEKRDGEISTQLSETQNSKFVVSETSESKSL
ncbi:hypothetical protein WN55_07050 [Dufourea novaeangliae]|uniref:N-acetyltransferase domain-containing protein n=1 Tax=Dufourea novaeangliae TaxID=178035 RepID=A0A154PRU6_DUFNO|nr:hypothetical protein WN55_07050 [Dufourea novaeangliae]